ncbi:hypothetical protein GP486_001806 [Trichoglossum hirsutum]|uniref:chitinase n=1 Tax=Trichoglossum hirsutum TaxID=265104 RepID=A0A9P8LGF0_9PEZI|nr:hypothetical protein GP486_001806 [Trichoglossum hirsutum]
MPPLLEEEPLETPKIVLYHQTHYYNGQFVSLLPLLSPGCGVTHVNIAAIHVNKDPGDVTLNDDPYSAPKNDALWAEVRILQSRGIKVLGMLGGAALGTYPRLDGDIESFSTYYKPLRDMVRWCGLDGLDLDVEESMSLSGITRLIDQLRSEFGPDFILTLTPVATAMWGEKHLSGFDYAKIERIRGKDIAWYNTMFYCGWGSMETTEHVDKIMESGWPAEKIVIGLSTNPETKGWVSGGVLRESLAAVVRKYPRIGGVMGWEYFNSITAIEEDQNPWCWPQFISGVLRPSVQPIMGEEPLTVA